jgi:hypothetical protein
MEIVTEPVKRMRLSAFADQHGLRMKVIERKPGDLHPQFKYETNRWYAQFDNAEVKDGICLVGTFGNGATKAEAIKDYAKKISGKRLVIDAFNKEKRREIEAPMLFR